ncbi:hypothetical protein WJX82_008738 [Trebouxia sp. C0006]
MWPVVLGKVVAGAALAVGGLLFWQKYQQEQERQQVFWEPFEAQRPSPENSANERIKEELLKTVRQKLLDIMNMVPGRERSAAIRELRARYHPDRHVHLPMLADIFEEIATLVNTRTDPLLVEDRLQHRWKRDSELPYVCASGMLSAFSCCNFENHTDSEYCTMCEWQEPIDVLVNQQVQILQL